MICAPESRIAPEPPLLHPPSSMPSIASKKMFATNCRSSAPTLGFPRLSPSAASSMTSPAAISAKSKTTDLLLLKLPPPPLPTLALFRYAKYMLDEKDFQRKADAAFEDLKRRMLTAGDVHGFDVEGESGK